MSRVFPEAVSDLTADDYMRLAWYTARIAPFRMKDDIRSAVVLALLRQVSRFDATKGKLSAFLFTRAHWAAVDYMDSENKHDRIRPKFERINGCEFKYKNGEFVEFEPPDPSYLSQEDMIDLKRVFIKRRDHTAKHEPQKKNGRKGVGVLYLKVETIASRRGNMPDPRYLGFPWSDK
jgi:DNA-directed RNA polymerase specialized sigma24 family protein